MTDRISSEDLARMMKSAAALIREQQARLSQLDSIAGDGDHGPTMVRIMDRLEAAFNRGSEEELRVCFRDAGWNVMNTDGGASASLLGVFFLATGESTKDDASSWNCSELASAFANGLHAVQEQTRAKPGDKTLLDALVPAIDAMTSAAKDGAPVSGGLRAAAEAAKAGAEATAAMVAHYGRARLLGDKTLGHEDAGAVSVALMFAGFSQAIPETKGSAANARYG